MGEGALTRLFRSFPGCPGGGLNPREKLGTHKRVQRHSFGRCLSLNAANKTMNQLATDLSMMLSTPVMDATGLKGSYDFTLSWLPDLAAMGAPASAPSVDDGGGPTLFAAIESQLGLKLVSKKGPVNTVVIDHIEKLPTQNETSSIASVRLGGRFYPSPPLILENYICRAIKDLAKIRSTYPLTTMLVWK